MFMVPQALPIGFPSNLLAGIQEVDARGPSLDGGHMTTKTVIIECRRARTKNEKQFYGITFPGDDTSHIFINHDKNRRGADLVDTLYHEFTHAVIGMYKTRIGGRREEKLCGRIGKMVTEAFRNA